MKSTIKTFFLSFLLLTLSFQLNAQDEPTIDLTEISASKKYGQKPKTAIKVGTVANEYKYLAQLSGPNGEVIEYKRISSCCEFDCPSCPIGLGLLDKWEIKYPGLKKPIIIYLNGYQYDDPKAPKSLGLK